MKILAHPKVRKERLEICQSCKWYKSHTKSCGTLIIGNDVSEEVLAENNVTYYKKEFTLCGCVMPVKTKLSMAKCPANKWTSALTDEDINQIKDFLKTINVIDGKIKVQRITSEQVKTIFEWMKKLKGQPVEITSCGKCIEDAVKSLIEEIQ
jgi:Cys-tRNA synthase (O-phospho-L-seryl-tRNA:Cys-tRNA synthase)